MVLPRLITAEAMAIAQQASPQSQDEICCMKGTSIVKLVDSKLLVCILDLNVNVHFICLFFTNG
jgi:hypothetical protein